MVAFVVSALFASIAVQADTVITLGLVERDLTGDGRPEVLRLVGAGQSVDSLEVTFTIESAGHRLFRMRLLPLTRNTGFDAGRRVRSQSEYLTKLNEFGRWFFDDAKFKRPEEFIERLLTAAPRHVPRIPEVIARNHRYQVVIDSLVDAGRSFEDAERGARSIPGGWTAPYDTAWASRTWDAIQTAGVMVFEFSRGGDSITAIAWSARDQRFYRLLECC